MSFTFHYKDSKKAKKDVVISQKPRPYRNQKTTAFR